MNVNDGTYPTLEEENLQHWADEAARLEYEADLKHWMEEAYRQYWESVRPRDGQELLSPEDQHRATARLQARVSALRAALYALRGKAPATLDRPTHPYTTQQEDQP